MSKCYLELELMDKYEERCDGCGKKIPEGDLIVTNITSCCGGGCCRILCTNCLTTMYLQLTKVQSNTDPK